MKSKFPLKLRVPPSLDEELTRLFGARELGWLATPAHRARTAIVEWITIRQATLAPIGPLLNALAFGAQPHEQVTEARGSLVQPMLTLEEWAELRRIASALGLSAAGTDTAVGQSALSEWIAIQAIQPRTPSQVIAELRRNRDRLNELLFTAKGGAEVPKVDPLLILTGGATGRGSRIAMEDPLGGRKPIRMFYGWSWHTGLLNDNEGGAAAGFGPVTICVCGSSVVDGRCFFDSDAEVDFEESDEDFFVETESRVQVSYWVRGTLIEDDKWKFFMVAKKSDSGTLLGLYEDIGYHERRSQLQPTSDDWGLITRPSGHVILRELKCNPDSDLRPLIFQTRSHLIRSVHDKNKDGLSPADEMLSWVLQSTRRNVGGRTLAWEKHELADLLARKIATMKEEWTKLDPSMNIAPAQADVSNFKPGLSTLP